MAALHELMSHGVHQVVVAVHEAPVSDFWHLLLDGDALTTHLKGGAGLTSTFRGLRRLCARQLSARLLAVASSKIARRSDMLPMLLAFRNCSQPSSHRVWRQSAVSTEVVTAFNVGRSRCRVRSISHSRCNSFASCCIDGGGPRV